MGDIHDSHGENESFPGLVQNPSPIAIVGMGMKLPGRVDSASSLWDLLINKRDGRCVTPPSRYNVDAFHKDLKTTGSVASRYGYFLQDDIDRFDAAFFSMSKAEVEKLDPQQRLLLEVAWECMQNGGQKDWRGSDIGCFVGVFGDVSICEFAYYGLPWLIILGLVRYGRKRSAKCGYVSDFRVRVFGGQQ